MKTIYGSATEAETENTTGGVCGQVGREVSHDLEVLAPQLAAGDSILRASAGDSESHLHDQRRRVAASLHMSLRKVTKARNSFPNDEAVLTLLYLALRNIAKKWTMPVQNWKDALNRFAIVYENRLPVD